VYSKKGYLTKQLVVCEVTVACVKEGTCAYVPLVNPAHKEAKADGLTLSPKIARRGPSEHTLGKPLTTQGSAGSRALKSRRRRPPYISHLPSFRPQGREGRSHASLFNCLSAASCLRR
jgi:hypothetical protein